MVLAKSGIYFENYFVKVNHTNLWDLGNGVDIACKYC